MKKVFIIMIAVIGFAFSANATTASCRVINSTVPNATVVAHIVGVEDGWVLVSFSSDENVKTVNVQFTVERRVGGTVHNVRGSGGIPPNQTVILRVRWPHSGEPTGLTINSARCSN